MVIGVVVVVVVIVVTIVMVMTDDYDDSDGVVVVDLVLAVLLLTWGFVSVRSSKRPTARPRLSTPSVRLCPSG